jgi:hypothetical protein
MGRSVNRRLLSSGTGSGTLEWNEVSSAIGIEAYPPNKGSVYHDGCRTGDAGARGSRQGTTQENVSLQWSAGAAVWRGDRRNEAGWSCYCWLLGSRPDSEFSESKLAKMLEQVERMIHDAPERTKYAMNQFIYTVATSYVPLHDKAVATAKAVGPVEVRSDKGESKLLQAVDHIQKMVEKGKLGFKRKHVRC